MKIDFSAPKTLVDKLFILKNDKGNCKLLTFYEIVYDVHKRNPSFIDGLFEIVTEEFEECTGIYMQSGDDSINITEQASEFWLSHENYNPFSLDPEWIPEIVRNTNAYMRHEAICQEQGWFYDDYVIWIAEQEADRS